jgi:hypothetical protein
MCSIKPKKVDPIDGETVFRFAFKRSKKYDSFKITGLFDPSSNAGKPGSKVGCLTIVAVKDEEGNTWTGVTAFRNTKIQEPHLKASINVARERLLRSIDRGEVDFTTPVLYNKSHEFPVPIITELPAYALEILEKRRSSTLFSTTSQA